MEIYVLKTHIRGWQKEEAQLRLEEARQWRTGRRSLPEFPSGPVERVGHLCPLSLPSWMTGAWRQELSWLGPGAWAHGWQGGPRSVDWCRCFSPSSPCRGRRKVLAAAGQGPLCLVHRAGLLSLERKWLRVGWPRSPGPSSWSPLHGTAVWRPLPLCCHSLPLLTLHPPGSLLPLSSPGGSWLHQGVHSHVLEVMLNMALKFFHRRKTLGGGARYVCKLRWCLLWVSYKQNSTSSHHTPPLALDTEAEGEPVLPLLLKYFRWL